MRTVRFTALLLPLLFVTPTGASARTYHHITIKLSPAATSGNAIPFSWSASAPGRIVVQRPEGTSHVWRTILRLHGHGGSATLPAFSIGVYHIRIAAIRGRIVAQSQALLRVYGRVPFTTLFHRYGVKTVTTPTNTFDYVAQPGLEDTPPLTVTNNTCTSLHIEWDTHILTSFRPAQITPDLQVTLSLVQEAREPESVTATYETISLLDATVEGKSWSLEAKNSNRRWDVAGYVNGYGVCDSTEELD
jgi:hypothetical protein